MATAPEHKRALRLVPTHRSPIDADLVAFNVMEFIDSEFPEMWLHAPALARMRLRNMIVKAVHEQEGEG